MHTIRFGGSTGTAPRMGVETMESSMGRAMAMPAFFKKSRLGKVFILSPGDSMPVGNGFYVISV